MADFWTGNILADNEMLGNAFEPKRSNRFWFQFDTDVIPSFVARVSSRPSITIEPITIDFINTKRYVAGKAEWGTMSLGLYDPLTPSSAQKVTNWIRLCYENISGRAGYAALYKKDFSLFMLDPVGNKIEEWLIQGAWITEATFGELNQESAEPIQIDLTIRMDNCLLKN